MYSVMTGLERLAENTDCFIQNVDNPFVTVDLLSSLLPYAHPEGYVVPVFKGKGGHPILLGAKVAKEIFNKEHGDLSLKEVLKNYKKIEMETQDEKVLVNINSKEDYKKYFPREK